MGEKTIPDYLLLHVYFKKKNTDRYFYLCFFFIIINVNFLYNTKECVSTSPGMWAQ